jgi:hypothetical protein
MGLFVVRSRERLQKKEIARREFIRQVNHSVATVLAESEDLQGVRLYRSLVSIESECDWQHLVLIEPAYISIDTSTQRNTAEI